jgi:putative transcriptional regulator
VHRGLGRVELPAAIEEASVAIVVNLDLLLVKRKMTLTELAGRVDITLANLSILKQNKARAVRFSTLDAICRELGCQPGELLEYQPDETRGPSAAGTAHAGIVE